MFIEYLKLTIATLLPVIACVILYFVSKSDKFNKLPYMLKQSIFGIVFGGLAILGTEWGIPIDGAQVNVRDGAVLCAGLLFGGPSGIIAGIIGGLERWVSIYWGVGTFTRVACSVSTILAGFYAAVLRKFMFENKRPSEFLAFGIGIVMEIFHLSMVFLTNMDEPELAMTVIKACSIPMITANGLCLFLSTMLLTMLHNKKLFSGFNIRKKNNIRIAQTIQRWLLLAVFLAFLVTTTFVFRLQSELAKAQYESLLANSLEETVDDINDASDNNLLLIAEKVRDKLDTITVSDYEKDKYNEVLKEIALDMGVKEIHRIDKNGIIYRSNVDEFVGWSMNSGEQSKEFVTRLITNNEEEYVQKYGPMSYNSSEYRKYAGVKYETGFIQVGYDATQFHKDISEKVKNSTANRTIGTSGYVLIFDSEFALVSSPKNFNSMDILTKAFTIKEKNQKETFVMNINGVECYCKYQTSEGYYMLSVISVEEAMRTRSVAMYVNTFMEILVFAVLFAVIYFLIKKVVVDRLKSVNESLGKITGGDLNTTVNVRTNQEFASLSDDINSTVDTLKKYIEDASKKIDEELEFAKNIQASALPSVFPAFPKRTDLDIYASMNPAKEVGGDFYDFYITNEDTLNVLIADVSGKGIPAAMFMMRAKTELKTLTESEFPINTVFTKGNEALCEGNVAGMFVTAWQGKIDLRMGNVQYVNAGHNPPLLKHKNGKFEYVKGRTGFVLAGLEGYNYKIQELKLEDGDILFLYTDGVTEATNANKELYGEERLLEAVNSKEFSSMAELCKFVKKEVDEFVGDAPQFDDITMLAFKYLPAPTIHFDEATLEDIPIVTEFVEKELEKYDCPMKVMMQIDVAIDEIYSNIVRYGYAEKKGPTTVKVTIKDNPKEVCLSFIDNGIPYNPLTKSDPDVTLSLEERKIGGLGIYIVKKSMDDVKYRYENDQNVLTIFKKF